MRTRSVRTGAQVCPGAPAVWATYWPLPARAGLTRADVRQHHRLRVHGHAPVANAGCRYHERRTRLTSESILHRQNARDGGLCPRTAGRQRYLARSPCRSLRGRCRSNLLLRGYPRNEFAYCWPRYHRLQRFCVEKELLSPLQVLEDARGPHAATDAHGHHAVACLAPLHLVQNLDGELGTGGSHWVTKGNGPAVDIDL